MQPGLSKAKPGMVRRRLPRIYFIQFDLQNFSGGCPVVSRSISSLGHRDIGLKARAFRGYLPVALDPAGLVHRTLQRWYASWRSRNSCS
jgi:hypothetical protein